MDEGIRFATTFRFSGDRLASHLRQLTFNPLYFISFADDSRISEAICTDYADAALTDGAAFVQLQQRLDELASQNYFYQFSKLKREIELILREDPKAFAAHQLFEEMRYQRYGFWPRLLRLIFGGCEYYNNIVFALNLMISHLVGKISDIQFAIDSVPHDSVEAIQTYRDELKPVEELVLTKETYSIEDWQLFIDGFRYCASLKDEEAFIQFETKCYDKLIEHLQTLEEDPARLDQVLDVWRKFFDDESKYFERSTIRFKEKVENYMLARFSADETALDDIIAWLDTVQLSRKLIQQAPTFKRQLMAIIEQKINADSYSYDWALKMFRDQRGHEDLGMTRERLWHMLIHKLDESKIETLEQLQEIVSEMCTEQHDVHGLITKPETAAVIEEKLETIIYGHINNNEFDALASLCDAAVFECAGEKLWPIRHVLVESVQHWLEDCTEDPQTLALIEALKDFPEGIFNMEDLKLRLHNRAQYLTEKSKLVEDPFDVDLDVEALDRLRELLDQGALSELKFSIGCATQNEQLHTLDKARLLSMASILSHKQTLSDHELRIVHELNRMSRESKLLTYFEDHSVYDAVHDERLAARFRKALTYYVTLYESEDTLLTNASGGFMEKLQHILIDDLVRVLSLIDLKQGEPIDKFKRTAYWQLVSDSLSTLSKHLQSSEFATLSELLGSKEQLKALSALVHSVRNDKSVDLLLTRETLTGFKVLSQLHHESVNALQGVRDCKQQFFAHITIQESFENKHVKQFLEMLRDNLSSTHIRRGPEYLLKRCERLYDDYIAKYEITDEYQLVEFKQWFTRQVIAQIRTFELHGAVPVRSDDHAHDQTLVEDLSRAILSNLGECPISEEISAYDAFRLALSTYLIDGDDSQLADCMNGKAVRTQRDLALIEAWAPDYFSEAMEQWFSLFKSGITNQINAEHWALFNAYLNIEYSALQVEELICHMDKDIQSVLSASRSLEDFKDILSGYHDLLFLFGKEGELSFGSTGIHSFNFANLTENAKAFIAAVFQDRYQSILFELGLGLSVDELADRLREHRSDIDFLIDRAENRGSVIELMSERVSEFYNRALLQVNAHDLSEKIPLIIELVRFKVTLLDIDYNEGVARTAFDSLLKYLDSYDQSKILPSNKLLFAVYVVVESTLAKEKALLFEKLLAPRFTNYHQGFLFKLLQGNDSEWLKSLPFANKENPFLHQRCMKELCTSYVEYWFQDGIISEPYEQTAEELSGLYFEEHASVLRFALLWLHQHENMTAMDILDEHVKAKLRKLSEQSYGVQIYSKRATVGLAEVDRSDESLSPDLQANLIIPNG